MQLESESVILAAPMSFAGSTRRIWRRWHPAALAAHGWHLAGIRAAMVTLLILAWLAVLCWYALLAVPGLAPLIILIIFRLVRRTQRRGERNRLRHAELLRLPGHHDA